MICLILVNESSIACQSFLNGSFSTWKWRCLILKIWQPSVPMHNYSNEAAFCSQVPKVYLRTKYQFRQSHQLHRFCKFRFSCWLRTFWSLSDACVLFSTGSSYVGSSGYVTAEGGPFIEVFIWTLLSPKMPISIVAFTCPTKVVVWRSVKSSMWRGIFLESTCDCAMLYSITFEKSMSNKCVLLEMTEAVRPRLTIYFLLI